MKQINKQWMHLTWQGVTSQRPIEVITSLLTTIGVLQQFEDAVTKIDIPLGDVIASARWEANAKLAPWDVRG